MGVGTVIIRRRVGLLKADLTTPVELPAALDADGGFKVHVLNPTSTSIPSNLRKEDGHGSVESNRSWGYVTEVDDDGNVLVARRPAAESRPVVLSNEDLAKLEAIRAAIAALPAPPSTVTANQGTAGVQSWKVLDDNSALIATRLLNIYTSLQGQREVATSVWTDNSGAYYVRRDIIDESSGTPVITVTFTDEAGAPATPGAGLRPVGGSDRELTQVLYVATSAGAGYSVGDVLARIAIFDASVSPPTATAVWFNLTTGAIISTPAGGTYEDAGELVGIKGVDGTGIATDANPFPTRDTPLKTSLEQRLGLLGRKPSSGSAPVVMSDEQESLLRQDAAYYSGVASSAAVVIAAFEVGSQGHFTITGATTGSWVNPTTGQAGLVAVEGSNDPGPGGGVPPTTGWGALRMENANGQSTTAMRGGGTFSSIVTTRWLRVRCLSYQAGSMDLNLVVFPRNRQLFRQNVKDVDGIASWEMTPGTGMGHVTQRTFLVGGNFDVGPLDSAVWSATVTGSGTATFVAGQGLKLATGATANSTVRIESMRRGNLLAGAANVADIIAATEAGAVAGCVKRWGMFDDDSGVFFEQFHDGTASRVTVKVRKGGVDTSGGALNGINNIGDNAFGVPLFNLYELQIDPLFVKAKQSGVLVHLFAGLFPSLFSRFDLPFRFEVINSGGASSNNTLYVQNAGAYRLGLQQSIRADESFKDDDVLAATAAVIQGRRFDGTFDQVPLPEHDRDLQNEQVLPLTNGTPVVFTVDATANTIQSVAHGLVSGNMVHLTTTGTLPAPLVVSALATGHYFVVNPTADTFQVSLTNPFGFPGATPVDITDVGVGVHSYSKAGEFIGSFTRIGDVDHAELLYASLTPMGGVYKVWSGDGVHGLNRNLVDGVTTNGSTTVTAANGFFTRYDKGARISGTGIPSGSYITAVASATSITISQAATATASGVAIALSSLLSPSSIPSTTLTGYNVYFDVNEGRNIAPFYLLRIYNGPTNQSAFPGFIAINWLVKTPYAGSFGLLNAALNNLSRALLVRSVQAGINPDGEFKNVATPGRSSDNSTEVPLAGDDGSTIYLDAFKRTTGTGQPHIFRGLWKLVQGDYVKVATDYSSDVSGDVFIDISQQGAPVNGIDDDVNESFLIPYDPLDDPIVNEHKVVRAKWVRSRVVNGLAAQTFVDLDTAFLVTDPGSDTKEVHVGVKEDDMASVVHSVPSVLDDESDPDDPLYTQERATLNPASGKRGKHSAITLIEDEVLLRGPPLGPKTATFLLTQTPQRIDLPDITGGTGHRYIQARNGGAFHMFTKEDNTITEVNSNPSFIGGEANYYLPPGGQLWGICESTGGAQQTSILAGSTAGGTATNPNNALTSNDVRAIRTAVGQTLYVEGFSFAFSPTFTGISRVRIGSEGRKQSGQFETVSQVEKRQGSVTSGGTVTTSAPFAAATEALLIAVITRNATNSITAVAGVGLTWLPLVQNVVANGKRMDIWYAYGNTTATTVTASQSTSTNAHIGVIRYANADPNTPIQASGSTTGTGTAVTGPSLAGTAKGYSVLSVVHDAASVTPGAGYTEQEDLTNGSGGNIVSLYAEDKALVATGAESATATLASSAPWAAVGLTILPKPATNPQTSLGYLYNLVAGATSSTLTFSNTVDAVQYVDITADRVTWMPADIALIRILSTVSVIGSAQVENDQLFVEVTETSGATTRVAVTQSGFQRTSGGL